MTDNRHVKYGGSTAGRTLGCPAWHSLAEKCPPPDESDAAITGTALHHIVEKCLLDVDVDPYQFVNQIVETVVITEELIDLKIYPALDTFEQLMDDYDIDRYHTEAYVDIMDDVGGTLDFIGISADSKTLVIADYKSGDGVLVDAKENAQGLFYAMCARSSAFRKYFQTAEKIVLAIVQPTERKETPLDVWETDVARIDKFQDDYLAAVEVARKGGSQPVLGEHCSFCPAAAFCPAKTGVVAAAERLPADSIQAEKLAEALEMADHVEKWAKAVRKMAYEQLSRGVPIKGFKLVNKRATRSWTNPEAVVAMIKRNRGMSINDAYDMALLSPAKLEKVCKGKGVDFEPFTQHIEKLSSGMTLARDDDSRPEAIPLAAAKVIADRFQ